MNEKTLSKKDVDHIASLAHIELSEDEKMLFTEQFNEILDFFKIIDNVDTKDLEPTYHVLGLTNISREDEIIDSLSTQEALKNVPKKEKNFLKAPRIV
jgi:aspartyl-tRNA(Asn)/glutamyl-tRNA(Gln) amidotransferase subunit C